MFGLNVDNPNELMNNKLPEYKYDIDELALDYGWTLIEKQRVNEYAKQESIAFAEWTEKNRYTLISHNNLWVRLGGRNSYTTEQLYELFQQSKLK